MSDFLTRMKTAAKADKKTIVLPEGEDPRTLEAARKIVEEGLANLVILGDPATIDVEGVTVIDPKSPTAPKILKTAPGTKLVSAFMVMCTKTPEFGADGTLVFADCGLNIDPTSDELSEIAIASANSFRTFMGDVEPKVAMLSYSTMGSAGGDTAKKVQEATPTAPSCRASPSR